MAKTTDIKPTKKTADAKPKTATEGKPAKASKSATAASLNAAAAPKEKKAAKTKTLHPGQDMINGMVAVAAYFLAEKRAFAPGFEEQDWLAAKAQIMAQLAEAKNPLK